MRGRLGVAEPPWYGADPAAMMPWSVAPDGREARDPVEFHNADGAARFDLPTPDKVRDRLRQAVVLRFSMGEDSIAETDARGMGAFRLAVQAQGRS